MIISAAGILLAGLTLVLMVDKLMAIFKSLSASLPLVSQDLLLAYQKLGKVGVVFAAGALAFIFISAAMGLRNRAVLWLGLSAVILTAAVWIVMLAGLLVPMLSLTSAVQG